MRKYVKGLQIFSFIAIVLTIILWIALWGNSALPGSESGKQTDKVTSVVDDSFGISDKVNDKLTTYQIEIEIKNKKKRYFANDTAETVVSYKPVETKDKAVIFSSSDESIATIDENGIITFNLPGTVEITARLKSNESVSARLLVKSYGEDIFDPEHPERMKFDYMNDEGELEGPMVGERRTLLVNEGKSDVNLLDISIDDEDILFYWMGTFYGRKQGETTVNFSYVDDEGEHKISQTVQVGGGVLPEIKLVGKNRSYKHGQTVNKNWFLDIPTEEVSLYDCIVESSDRNIASLINSNILKMNDVGEAILTFTSLFDPTKTVQVKITVKVNAPTSIEIVGPDVIVCNDHEEYSANLAPVNYSNDVTWSVVKGNGKMTQDGRLTATGYGTIVIRCTSNLDENVYVEKVIKVKLFKNAYGFVRKALGHGGLSAVLGFGIFGTLLLLLKRRYLIVTAFPTAFIYAVVSELIQKYTPGRYNSWNDVLIDFLGALIGMAVALLLMVLLCLVWRLANKKSFQKFKDAWKVVNFKTLFMKTDKLVLLCENMNISEPMDDTESEVTTSVLERGNVEIVGEVLSADVDTSENAENPNSPTKNESDSE